MLLRCKELAVAVLGGGLFVSCSGQDSATGPSNPTSPSCRTYATAYTQLQTGSASPGFAATTTGTCSFSQSALQFSCTTRYSDTTGFSSTTTSVATYAALQDILDEVAVIPPLKRLVSFTGTTAGQGTGTTTYTYDSQKRLTRESGSNTTTTYSAWDNPGRPTAAVTTSPNSTTTLSMSYNDSARTLTTSNTQTTGATTVTTSCTQTYDANGNQISYLCGSTAPGTGTTTGATSITSTGQVCR